jgi:hypothetical protein
LKERRKNGRIGEVGARSDEQSYFEAGLIGRMAFFALHGCYVRGAG